LKHPPRDIVDGIGIGFSNFFSSIGKGISGIVVSPIESYKKKKAKGLPLGIA